MGAKLCIAGMVLICSVQVTLGQALCDIPGVDSLLTSVQTKKRCGPFMNSGQQHAGVNSCWYSSEVNGQDLIQGYLGSTTKRSLVEYVPAPGSGGNDSLLNGALYVHKGKSMFIVHIVDGYVTLITFQGRYYFNSYDFSILNECHLPIVVNTIGKHYDVYQNIRSGWELEQTTDLYLRDGSMRTIRGQYRDPILKHLKETK
jgi:hypothetical protein